VDGHVWALTPNEMREALRRGDTAVRDALAKGERLFPEGGRSRYADLAGEWPATGAKKTLLEKAPDDLEAAELILSAATGRRQGWWTVAFHADRPPSGRSRPSSTTWVASRNGRIA
jgi:hypothetical protein